jgi:uncharacterized protein (TIGR03032 family)
MSVSSIDTGVAPTERAVQKPVDAIDYQATPSFVALLEQLGCSLVISNYQSSTVMTFSTLEDGRPVQMFAPFRAAMGLALEGDRLAVAARSEVVILTNLRALAPRFPKYPGLFDGYFVPRARYITGDCALHDLAFDGAAVLAVNTNYSCVCRIDGIRNFEPIWTPSFISEIRPGDRCHLNGMALADGTLRYVTALGTSNVSRGWTTDKLTGGVVMDAPTGEIVARGLCMPHSPRLIDGKLYLVEAGTGTLSTIDPASGARTPIVTLPGFARGMAEHGGYLFVGLSLVRESLGFKNLPIEQSGQELICGVVAIEIASGNVVGTLRYIGGCSEIHDIQVMAGVRRLGISGCEADTTRLAIDIPGLGLWLDPEPEEGQPAGRDKEMEALP